ncbi:hypothetical protein GCM10023187_16480 [Nibrella viscosa]|uniref:Uncharacterized protein n=1 Tax=Nibrella viscosa TaxID=1084524 RepID=A0ABP8K7G1_9BACT
MLSLRHIETETGKGSFGLTGLLHGIAYPLHLLGQFFRLFQTLGPLDLNLLGLVVHLDQVNLNIDLSPDQVTCWGICYVPLPAYWIRLIS